MKFFNLLTVSMCFLLACASTTPSGAEEAKPTEFPRADPASIDTVDGSAVLVRVLLEPGKTLPPKATAEFEGKTFPLFEMEGGAAALVVVPYDSKPRASVIHLKGLGKEAIAVPIQVSEGKYKKEKLNVDEKHVNPPARAVKRILKEQKEIGAVYRQVTAERYWDKFQTPIDTVITSDYGGKRIFNGEKSTSHQGTDFRAPTGSSIHAPAGGKVAMAKDLYFTGNTVILDHGYGLYTIYAHLSKLRVKKGQRVRGGQLLGLSGATGRASGPHLHWGAVLQREKFNPMNLVELKLPESTKTGSPNPAP